MKRHTLRFFSCSPKFSDPAALHIARDEHRELVAPCESGERRSSCCSLESGVGLEIRSLFVFMQRGMRIWR